ncbi:hypothetical protein Q0N51_12405 [Priestia megaterium]|uniref:hypothetical protein n=1 Tax=Priestia megaterium TaxID=1404 RepID=UPI00345775CB
MWKVDTTDIYKYLFVTDMFVSDVFEWLKENRLNSIGDIEENLRADTSLLGDVANSLDSLFTSLVDLVSHEKIDEIINIYENMEKDYFTFLEGGANTVVLSSSAEEIVKKTFSYFYKELLNRSSFWDAYENGNKNSSTSEFRQKIGRGRPICPYCDAAKVQYYKHSNSDHFLAYSHFPFLAIHWENLVVSCLGCNLYVKGDKLIGTRDGEANFIPIFHPYFHEVASYINFKFDQDLNITIEPSPNERVTNYLNLFEIENVYEGAHHDVVSLWEEVVDDIQDKYNKHQNVNNETEVDKLKRIYRETIINKKEKSERAKGKVGYSKLFIDLCNYKLSQDEMMKQLVFLQNELGIPSEIQEGTLM